MAFKKFNVYYDSRGKLFSTQEVKVETKNKIVSLPPNLNAVKSNPPKRIKDTGQKKTALTGDFMINQKGVQFILQEIERGSKYTVDEAKIAIFEHYKVITPHRSNKKIQKSAEEAVMYLTKHKHI